MSARVNEDVSKGFAHETNSGTIEKATMKKLMTNFMLEIFQKTSLLLQNTKRKLYLY